MSLDFEKFAKPCLAVVPINGGEFVYHKKKYRLSGENGWAVVEITGNRARKVDFATVYWEGAPDRILGYTHNNTLIFQNFDVAKRKFRLQIQAPLHFNQSRTFEAVRAIVWEDGNVYWCEPNYSDAKIFEVKDLYDQEKPLADTKGITPELRTLYLHHTIERDNMRKMLEAAKQAEEREAFMKSIPGRLQLTFKNAGAEMVNFSMSGKRIVVDWKMPGTQYQYNSVIDSDTWMIVEAGYCMSGDDKRHNITSMVKTAQEYNDRRVTYITRTTGNEDPTVRGPHLDREDEDDFD